MINLKFYVKSTKKGLELSPLLRGASKSFLKWSLSTNVFWKFICVFVYMQKFKGPVNEFCTQVWIRRMQRFLLMLWHSGQEMGGLSWDALGGGIKCLFEKNSAFKSEGQWVSVGEGRQVAMAYWHSHLKYLWLPIWWTNCVQSPPAFEN